MGSNRKELLNLQRRTLCPDTKKMDIRRTLSPLFIGGVSGCPLSKKITDLESWRRGRENNAAVQRRRDSKDSELHESRTASLETGKARTAVCPSWPADPVQRDGPPGVRGAQYRECAFLEA